MHLLSYLRAYGVERLGVWARSSAELCDDDALSVATEVVTRLGACVFDLKFSSVSNNMHLVLKPNQGTFMYTV